MHTKDKPCIECPFRKVSAKGYLGILNAEPETFLQQLNLPDLLPCHLEINWEEEDEYVLEGEVETANRCTGALQFMNNSGRMSRNPDILALQNKIGKSQDVIQTVPDFIKHHKTIRK